MHPSSRQLAGDNERKVALVVNEIGEIPVDGKVIEESGMLVKDIGGGCTHWGTIPSKALRHSVSQLIELKNNALFTNNYPQNKTLRTHPLRLFS